MVRDYLKAIKENVDVRKNLIALRAEIKENQGRHALLYALENQFQIFYDLLKAEDPKIRKNAALILGRLGVQESLSKLYEAYEKEKTLFVRGSYLTAIKELDYRSYVGRMKEQLAALLDMPKDTDNKKHILEEIRLLKEMIITIEGRKKHTFTGYHKTARMLLLTNRNFREITMNQVKSYRPKLYSAGVMIKTDELEEVLKIRTFSELLFVLEDLTVLRSNGESHVDTMAKEFASRIWESSLMEFLKERHKEDMPFFFRLECKAKMDLKKKSSFTRKLAEYLEEQSEGKLQNSTSHYEIELRMVENKNGDFNFMVKLFTLPDTRFSYRKQALATSIQPVNAALAMALADKYLTEGAQVLDPFCGVGTMLVERSKFRKTGDMYGIDIFGKGIEAARRNTEFAREQINYINRDFFDFTHDYLFDEIVSNMPRVMGKKTEADIRTLYCKFWKKAAIHLKEQGILLLYCYDKKILLDTCPRNRYEILEEFEISKKEDAYCFVLRRHE